ncbi:MAG TPA: hypothetical protein VNK24_06065 [Elusimicrobiota bacterium]|nr:hypothetical protein [Elusimicrobiota bacterium]
MRRHAPAPRLFRFLAAAAALWAFAPVLALGGQETGFLPRSLSFRGAVRRYEVYVPADWTPDKKWPVILFLNGTGERGSDGVAETTSGFGPALKAHPERFPAVVVFPQCPGGDWWTSPGMTGLAMKALKKEIKEFRGDKRRIYLTGISMGGYGVWRMAADHPGFFAALTPISGAIHSPASIPEIPPAIDFLSGQDPFAVLAEKIGATPVWVFHDADDPLVSVADDRRIAAAFAGRPTFHYTELTGYGHLAWLGAYADAAWARWLFAQQKPASPGR